MLNKKNIFLVVLFIFLSLCFPSCTNEEDNIENTAPVEDLLQSESTTAYTTADDIISNVETINPYIFRKFTPLDIIEKRITASDYDGAPPYYQIYTLSLYKSISNFSDIYSGKQFQKIIFDDIDKYESFGLAQLYKQYLYFQVIKNSDSAYVLRYNMDDGTQDIIFTYNGENQIAIYAVNDN